MKIEFDWPDSVPEDQIDKPFIQGMLDRMAFGYHNYGHMRRDENVSNSLKNVRIRLDKYEETHNTEFLMDASNYCMMEFVKPGFSDAFFRPTTKEESPGAIVGGRHVQGKEDYPKTRTIREGD